MADKIEMTWLQAQLPKSDWEAINERRLKLKLTWLEVLRPATLAYLDKLEAEQPKAEAPVKVAKVKKAKSKRVVKATGNGKKLDTVAKLDAAGKLTKEETK